MIVGAIASGDLSTALTPLRADHSISLSLNTADASLWWSAWMSPFSLILGFMTTALFAWLAAIYLHYELEVAALAEEKHTPQSEELLLLRTLQNKVRLRAYIAQGILAFMAFSALLIVGTGAVRDRLLMGSFAPYLHLWVGCSSIGALWALKSGRAALARILGASQAVGIVSGWTVASWPFLIPDQLKILEAAASPTTLSATLICVTCALVLVLPSLWWLFRIFKDQVPK